MKTNYVERMGFKDYGKGLCHTIQKIDHHPPLPPYPSLFRELSHKGGILAEIEKLLWVGPVVEVPEYWRGGESWLLFPLLSGVEEGWGVFHLIRDWSDLNKHIWKFQFPMLTSLRF